MSGIRRSRLALNADEFRARWQWWHRATDIATDVTQATVTTPVVSILDVVSQLRNGQAVDNYELDNGNGCSLITHHPSTPG